MTDAGAARPLPIASYRVQLTADAGFDHVLGLLDHLEALGVSHVYLSPVTEAVPGSGHGYDVVDHTRVRAELGGADGLDRLLDAAADRDMVVVIDHVPNHCSTSRPELNGPWWSMLRDGPSSSGAAWFDVDRGHPTADGRVLLPVLGGPLDEVLADGGIEVAPADDVVGEPHLLVHGGLRLPLAPGTADAADDLPALLGLQHYELRWWRDPERNVRRFFTIDDLVAVRVEDPAVAEMVDSVPARLTGRRGFGGVRVDHVDGLADPAGYLASLRARLGDDAWLLVEKILAPDEWLPSTWSVDGTTGYEFARVLDQVMVAPGAHRTFDALWDAAIAEVDDDRVQGDYHRVEDLARREVLTEGLAPDLDRAVAAVHAAVQGAQGAQIGQVAEVVTELTVRLPRYRTYLPDDPDGARLLADVVASVVHDRPDLGDLAERVAAVLLRPSSDADRHARTRWQQLTGPAMAKGAEDRAFFRYLRWAALCEVGGDPGRCGATIGEFHDAMSATAQRWPRTMLTVSTHDTKRAAHVRARAAALTADHEAWAQAVRGWLPIVRELEPAIRPTTVLHALQTVATCPGLDVDRLTAFLVKSAREAELRTAWTDVDPDHEDRLRRLAEILVGDHDVAASVALWAERLERPGRAVSIVGTALRWTVPGVPDTYQGTEVPSYRLVDPDNRVDPDWSSIRAIVEAAGSLDLAAAWRDHPDAAEAVVMRRIASLRRRRPDAFGGDHTPVPVSGEESDRVVAYVRGVVLDGADGERVASDDSDTDTGTDTSTDQVVVVAALPGAAFRLAGSGGPTLQLPPGRWRHVLVDDADPDDAGPIEGGQAVTVVGLLGGLPVAVLERVS